MAEQSAAGKRSGGGAKRRPNGGGARGAHSQRRDKAGGAANGGGPSSAGRSSNQRSASTLAKAEVLPNLVPPFHSLAFLKDEYYDVISGGKIKQMHFDNPKSPLQNYVAARTGANAVFEAQEGFVDARRDSTVRVTVLADEEHSIIGYGDAKTQKEAEKVAALHALLQLARFNLLVSKPPRMASAVASGANAFKDAAAGPTAKLSDGTAVSSERAREFIDFYCIHFKFPKPELKVSPRTHSSGRKVVKTEWHVELSIGGVKMGESAAGSKKTATTGAFLDSAVYLDSCDNQLWKTFSVLHKPGSSVTANMPKVHFQMSDEIDDQVRNVYEQTKTTLLFSKRPRSAGHMVPSEARDGAEPKNKRRGDDRRKFTNASETFLEEKSQKLQKQLLDYQADETMRKMRDQRQSLPVYKRASDVLVKVELNQITIVMAATGSGKTTQVPQILFDDYIMQGQGAKCNIICTQPRRIAAISVAERVAKERGETIGKTIGYQVRFENKAPQPHGSVTFCTTGVFLRRLQSALSDESSTNVFLDSLTHIVLDEVHERDLETDLLLVVLKRLLAERKRLGKKEIKVILMSATIDPKMFCNYFADPDTGIPAPVVEVSGRSFPVERHYLEETYHHLDSLRLPTQAGGWVWNEKNVREYLDRELSTNAGITTVGDENTDLVDDLELPYPLVALMIADVLSRSDDGHVLCFLPGWDEIKAVNQILEDTANCPLMGINFNDRDAFEIHILHSSIPVADQQAIFEPVRKEGIRRIILSTNIAETSVTIPDVVFVVDSGRVKESRYDPERHLSSLVSAWVGTSNINQRAGRAGRHRPGEAYAVFSKARYDQLNVSSTVEMKRVDLSNVAMHIKALDIPGMDVEDVLDAAIEAPAAERVRAALNKLVMVGALDSNRELTSLGRVLLQLPIDAPIGKMCLYGAFFGCLDPALTLAAVLTNRDPWMAPLHLKDEAGAIKYSWSMSDFRSDPMCTLRAFMKWDMMMKRGSQWEATRFCNENFLGRITFGQIQQVKEHLFQSLEKTGIFDTILGSQQHSNGDSYRRNRFGGRRLDSTTPELNINSGSAPMLGALIALASVPNFAVRSTERVYRTGQDKSCQIHPSSVQHLKHTKQDEEYHGERHLFAFSEKSKNISQANSSGGPTMLRNVTRLDLLTYLLFGANQLRPSFDGGMLCDDWLPIQGNFDALDNVDRLKAIMDVCMLRVFEGISPESNADVAARAGAGALERREVEEMQRLAEGIVRIMDAFAKERIAQSRGSTRPATPLAYGASNGGGGSGHGSGVNTPSLRLGDAVKGGFDGAAPNGGGHWRA